MNKTVKKTLIITGIVVGSIAGLFLLLYFILFLIGLKYGGVRDIREYVCDIPETNSGWAMQGITYTGEEFIHTGYAGENIVCFIGSGKSFKRVTLTDKDGKRAKGHAGGVACAGDNVYVANDNFILRYALSELKAAAPGGEVQVKQSIAMDVGAAYCFSDKNYLYVGEFYRKQNYPTPQSHHYTTPSGEDNKAIVSCYKLDENGMVAEEGVQPYPEFCISITELVQGFAISGNTVVLSRSYGLVDSKLDYHTLPADGGAKITVAFEANESAEQKEVPLYYLDGTTLFKTLTLPSFSEDLTIKDGRVVATNESAANKYIVGKLFGATKVYSYPIYENN